MGYLSTDRIQKFAEGKTIMAIVEADPQTWFLRFTDGTALRLASHLETRETGRKGGEGERPHREIKVYGTVIATPFTADGRVGYR